MNVLALTVSTMRVRLALRCAMSTLHIGGYALLLYVNWQIAVGVLLIEWARNVRGRVGGVGA